MHNLASTVDPVNDGVPNYFDMQVYRPRSSFERAANELYHYSVRREDARDLRTIKERIQRTKDGVTLESLDADIYLMLQNARRFNPEGTVVHDAAIEIGKRWDQLRADIELERKGQYWGPGDGDSKNRR